ncbi:MAG: RluA family pseudouridine synthase [Magnetococcales bacterium]|nr:RluA family pseudouridine synthase [Magnetococcales bacterium]
MMETNEGNLPVCHLEVTPEESGMRLERFIQRRMKDLPEVAIFRWIRTGQVRVEGGRCRVGRRVEAGEKVRIPPHRPVVEAEGGQCVPRRVVEGLRERILWRDEWLLVMDKPEGMVVHSGSNQSWGLIDALKEYWRGQGLPGLPELCHRLDRETSGCLLLGVDRRAVAGLVAAFKQGRVAKRYLTLVQGQPPERGTISAPLVKGHLQGGERMVVVEGQGGQPALTRYRVLHRFPEAALLLVEPATGRTHQIRAHCQWAGHVLAGDPKYGEKTFNQRLRELGLRRLFLHAWEVTFSHPLTNRSVVVRAPLPADLQQFLGKLDAAFHWEEGIDISGNI